MDFWAQHGIGSGILLLIGFACFPRLMLLFWVTAPFDPMAWVVWVVSPSLVVAYLASIAYWDTNPVLVLAAWAIAIPKAIIFKEWASEQLVGPTPPPLPTCPRHTTYRGKGPAPDCATCLNILAEVQRREQQREEQAVLKAKEDWERRQPKPVPQPADCPVHGQHQGERPPVTDCAVCHANYAVWKRAKWKAKWAARWKGATS